MYLFISSMLLLVVGYFFHQYIDIPYYNKPLPKDASFATNVPKVAEGDYWKNSIYMVLAKIVWLTSNILFILIILTGHARMTKSFFH